ncbi:MAG TPA: hypothetical protein VF551_02405, partial [Chthoniobacterales bacterium]
PEKINDGLRLLDENASPTARIETFDFTNPFPFASLRPPNKGGSAGWQRGFTLSERRYHPPERILGNADVVMVPKSSGNPPTTALLLELYADYLRAHFALGAETEHWSLLARRTPESTAPELDIPKMQAEIRPKE